MSQAPYGQTPAGPPNWPAPEPSSSRGHSRLPIISSVGIALVAVAIAIGSWFRPSPTPDAPPLKTYSSQEVADAKKAVCAAYEKVRATLDANNSKASVNPADSFAIAVNTRLAIHVAGDYLALVLDANRSAPPQLATNAHELTYEYQAIVLDQIGDTPRAQLDAAYQRADKLSADVLQECE